VSLRFSRPARFFLNSGCIVGLGLAVTCIGAMGEARAVALQAGVAEFNAVTGPCTPNLGAPPDTGSMSALAMGRSFGGHAAELATGSSTNSGAGIDPCLQSKGLFEELTISGSTQTVSTQVSVRSTGEVEGRVQQIGTVSVSVMYDADLFVPLLNEPVGEVVGLESAPSGSIDARAVSPIGSEVDSSARVVSDFRDALAFVEFIPVSSLPVGDSAHSTGDNLVKYTTNATLPAGQAVVSAGGNKGRGLPAQEQAVSSDTFWLVFFGVIGLVAIVFGLFSLISLVIEIARRRVA